MSVDGRPLVDPWSDGNPVFAPVFLQHRPEHLIDVIAVQAHGTSEDAFLNGTELSQRAVRTAVAQQYPRLESVGSDRSERERSDQPREFQKHAAASPRGGDGAFPFGGFE